MMQPKIYIVTMLQCRQRHRENDSLCHKSGVDL